jgi:hypothetical protein
MTEQSKPLIQIDNEVREMTEEEFKVYTQEQNAFKAEEKAKADKLAARQSALAKLASLGLTEEEIASL